MPIYTQKRINRADLRSNPHVTYVFGDNLIRKGFGGQAAEMRGEPNAFGIPTKASPSAYLHDGAVLCVVREWADKFYTLDAWLGIDKTVIWPEDGIGTGLSDLPNRAPKLWTILETMREALFEQYYAGRIEDV